MTDQRETKFGELATAPLVECQWDRDSPYTVTQFALKEKQLES